jgi:hypothetical protein
VAGGDAAVPFEAVDAALHGVALLVGVGVEGGRTAALGAAFAAVGVLVGFAGNAGFDAAGAEMPAVAFRGVGLVGQDQVRAGVGRPPPIRATLMLRRTGMSWGQSARCPAVSVNARTFWPCSQARCVWWSVRPATVRGRGRRVPRGCRRVVLSAGALRGGRRRRAGGRG